MRYYIPKEGVIMAEALGQELLIDLYSCDEDAISSATAVQESVATAFDLAELDVDEISCQVMDEEIALLSVAPGFHFTLHTYPALGKSFRAEKVKATSVQRGDFGNERDMKPRRKTKITTLGRVSRTRIQLKQTGGKLKKQSAKVIKTLAKKSGLKK